MEEPCFSHVKLRGFTYTGFLPRSAFFHPEHNFNDSLILPYTYKFRKKRRNFSGVLMTENNDNGFAFFLVRVQNTSLAKISRKEEGISVRIDWSHNAEG